MKHFQLFLISIFLFTAIIHAQERAAEQISTEQRAENFVIKLNEKMHLNKSKSDSITLVFKSYYEEMQTYRTEGNIEVMKLFVQRRDKKVQDILMNDDQYAVYIKLLEDLKKQRQQQREQNGSQDGRQRGGMSRPGSGMGGGFGGGMGGMRQPGF
ncbi:MAG: hypothetical protein WCO28_01160 [Bacteroidota bacterium]